MHSILAARTDFSLGESILSVENLVDTAAAMGAKAVGILDTMTVTGMIDLTKRAKTKEIKPVVGVRLRLTSDPTWRPAAHEKKKDMPKPHFVSAYVLTDEGLRAIYRLLTRSYRDDYFYYEPKLGYQDFLDELSRIGPNELAVVLGGERSVLERNDYLAVYEEIAKALDGNIDNVYAQITAVNTPYFTTLNTRALDLIENHNVKPLTLRPTYYLRGDADAHEVMGAIAANVKVTDGRHRSAYNRDFHLMDAAEMAREIAATVKNLNRRGHRTAGPRAVEGFRNTAEFVDRISFEWKKQPVSLPVMAQDEFGQVKKECAEGWKRRFSQPVFGHQPTKQELDELYMPRLKYELEILKKLNFSGYFLLVQDVVRYAKSNGILVGPGRGSVGGSLVAYLMGITDCDPIRFGLLFERFINPERIDLPDADLDFMSARRHEIVEYLVRKYGSDRVAGVSNFGKLGAASSIRDVSRVFALPENEYRCSKLVPKKHGQPVDLDEAVQEVEEIRDFSQKLPGLWEIMRKVEGKIRSFSQHAAGIVVAGVPLEERGVVERRSDTAVINWDKRIVEDQGLVKMDILGLNTLDLIDLTLRYIKERRKIDVDLGSIPLDDQKVLEAFARGDTTGIFQYEGGAARRMLKDMSRNGIPLTFEDVAAVSALNRPGPLEAGLDQLYIDNREGTGTVTYVSPHMENALKDTFGAIVYQEQVMQIAKDLSGFTGAEADVLRKAIGKKDGDLMARQKEKFVKGAELGYIEVTLEDGSVKKVHRARKFPVMESDELFTIEEIFSRGFSLKGSL